MTPRNRMRLGLTARFVAVVAIVAALAVAATLLLVRWMPDDAFVAAAMAFGIALAVGIALVRSQAQPLLAIMRALGGTVTSYRDGDYSFSLHWPRQDEMKELVDAHNALGEVLREQRLGLIQRELLLDTMVQNTPVAMLLVQGSGPVVFANIAARQLLNRGKSMEGMEIARVLHRADPSLREAFARGGDGLFSVDSPGGEEDIYHLARRHFTLNGRSHELLLLRHLTAELRRQEVQTWKKVLRVISHELNNSLAPVASLANSGAELVRRGKVDKLPGILGTIEDRARHLERFIGGYVTFAKLPSPRIQSVRWAPFIAAMQSQIPFRLEGKLPEADARFDPAQIEQALINLLKNAHESGSAPEAVSLAVRVSGEHVLVEVSDGGSGMTDAVMASAVVPFYSTKRTGTGLGLALAREIAEAHGGRIALHNREGGGLTVVMILPA